MINGKKFDEALKELRAIRPPKEEKGDTGFLYYPIEAYIEAMDKVFGSDHYSFFFSEPSYKVLASGQEIITVRCQLTITDDNGAVVKRLSGIGDREVFYNSSGRTDGGNITSAAATASLKDACKYLGIFGYRCSGEKPSKPSKTKAADEVLRFDISAKFYKSGEDDKGNVIWKLPADKSEVIFYHNMTSKKANRFNELIAYVDRNLDSGKKLTVKLKVKPTGEKQGLKQYVFKDFAA